MRVAVVILLALALSGCALLSSGPTVTQNVPVPVPCELPDVPPPAVPVDALQPDPDVFAAARALWASVEVLEGYAAQLRAAADGCRSR